MSDKFHCSFCGKSRDDVRRLIAGPGNLFICDEDVRICGEIVRECEIEDTARKIIKDDLTELKKSIENIAKRRDRKVLSWVLRKMGCSS